MGVGTKRTRLFVLVVVLLIAASVGVYLRTKWKPDPDAPPPRDKRIPTAFAIDTPHGVETIEMTVSYLKMRTGRFELSERHAMMSCLSTGSIVLDLGAHCGYHTIALSKALGPDGKIYAFEPSSETYDLLVENLRHNQCKNVVPLKIAVGDRATTAVFWHDRRKSARDSLARGVTDALTSEVVEVRTLDSMFEGTSITLIKSDIQGADPLALRGAKRLIERSRPHIMLEFWPFGLRQFDEDPASFLRELRRMGYDLHAVRSGKWRRFSDTEILDKCPKEGHVNLFLRPIR